MSTKKYSPRSIPIITRESYNVETTPRSSNLMDEFAANLEKQSVESRSKANKSIYDQISSIMGNKSKYSSVEAAVEDMKERSGMKDFLNKLHSEGHNDSNTQKKADCAACTNKEEHEHTDGTKVIRLFESVPQIEDTVNNYIEDTNGNLPIPAIVEKIKSIHRNDIIEDSDLDDADFLQYINDKNIDAKKKHPENNSGYKNLGKIPSLNNDEVDISNNDAFHALTPAAIK